MTLFEFGNRQDLWSFKKRSKNLPAPEFDKTGMYRNRFNILVSAIRFSFQPEQQGVQSSVRHR
jgi:hypothetical protein